MKIAFYTLGCKVNQYETQLMSEVLMSQGYVRVGLDDNPDVVIVNSCTVTSESDRKSRNVINKIRRNNPDCIIVLTGCMPQAAPDKAEELTGADIILGNTDHQSINQYILKFINDRCRIVDIKSHKTGEKFEKSSGIDNFDEHTRAFVKIEDGCNRFCSYCIIPYARGRVRSKPIEDITAEVQKLCEHGYKEIVLVGINLSAYGEDLGINLCDAVEAIDRLGYNVRIRLGSLEADLLTPEIIDRLAKVKNLCPHFHLSLQSGCSKTLKMMNRKYDAEDFRLLVDSIRKGFDNSSVTTDIIVGFAGETEEDFEDSLEFVKSIGFARSHVFPYSVRRGTRAEKFDGQVTSKEKSRRSKIMIETCEKSEFDFLRSQIGKIENVLFERSNDSQTYGYSENYSEIKVAKDVSLHGKTASVKIEAVDENGKCLIASLI